MAYEQRSGDIAVFKETDKKNEKGPDWKGTMIVPDDAKPGDKLEVAFWAKGDKGTMLAGSVKLAFQKGGQTDAAFPSRRDEGVSGGDRHGRGQDAGRKAAYEAAQRDEAGLRPFDDPFGEPPF